MNRIKELRLLNKWRQEDLAARLNVGKGTVSRYEAELLGLDANTIHLLCDLFGVTSDYLLCRSSTPTMAMTEDESALLRAYRAASEDAKAVVNLTLKPYMGNADRKDAVS